MFLASLSKVTKLSGWRVLAWCLLETHYHLLLLAGRELQVSRGMQMLNSLRARDVNCRYDRRGHVFGARYRPTRIDSEGHLLAAIAYTLRNPMRAGLVPRIEEWPWSGTTKLAPCRIDTFSSRTRDDLVRPRG